MTEKIAAKFKGMLDCQRAKQGKDGIVGDLVLKGTSKTVMRHGKPVSTMKIEAFDHPDLLPSLNPSRINRAKPPTSMDATL